MTWSHPDPLDTSTQGYASTRGGELRTDLSVRSSRLRRFNNLRQWIESAGWSVQMLAGGLLTRNNYLSVVKYRDASVTGARTLMMGGV